MKALSGFSRSFALLLFCPGWLLLPLPGGRPAGPAAPAPPPDAKARVDFTVDGDGHHGERVQLRDSYPEVPAPFACFYHSGIMFGVDAPVLELRTGKLGPKLWTCHLLLENKAGGRALPVVSAQPALIYNGDNSARQHAYYPQVVLPPLRLGTLAATLLPATAPGRVRGTFAGTLVDDKGAEITISNGTFDLARRPDVE